MDRVQLYMHSILGIGINMELRAIKVREKERNSWTHRAQRHRAREKLISCMLQLGQLKHNSQAGSMSASSKAPGSRHFQKPPA